MSLLPSPSRPWRRVPRPGQSAPPLPSRPPAIALPGGSAAPVSAAGCLARRTGGPLPVWARSGFHPPRMPIGHVMPGRYRRHSLGRAKIVAVCPRRCLTWETKSCGCRGSRQARSAAEGPCHAQRHAPHRCPGAARCRPVIRRSPSTWMLDTGSELVGIEIKSSCGTRLPDPGGLPGVPPLVVPVP